MDLSFTQEEQAFQLEVRQFLRDNLPEDIARKVRQNETIGKEDQERWQAILSAQGWLAVAWPVEHGGAGWGPVRQHIFEMECADAYAPRIIPFGLNMLAPVLMKFGTAEQCSSILPRILSGEDWWCQGYSEPGAGSDLASLRTRAVLDGDSYIINGQKTWTTLAQHANRMFCLVRTSTEGKPQEGISFVYFDMDQPGVDVQPIRLIEGGHEVNNVFLEDVRVPVSQRVGAENQGWAIAKYLLSHERTGIAGVGSSLRLLKDIRQLASQIMRNGKALIEDTLFAARLAEIEIDLEAMRVTNLRMLAKAEASGSPGPEASMLKIKGTIIRQSLDDLARRALGPAGAALADSSLSGNLALVPEAAARNAESYFNDRKLSIFGGSNEIQRGILAKHVLGL